MRGARGHVAAIGLAALAAGGGSCGGGDGSGGSAAVVRVESPDSRCAALSSAAFPPAFAFVPGAPGRVLAFDFSPPSLVTLEVEPVPPRVTLAPPVFELPADSDGDGRPEGAFPIVAIPIPDGVFPESADLAWVTTSSYEAVLFFDPGLGELREFRVQAPAPPFVQADNILWPPPGVSRLQTGISTAACVRPDPDALDSRGDSVAVALARVPRCDPDTPSYSPNFTSGAVLAGGRLFVSMSNLNEDQGTLDTQYLPGAVLVYDVDLSVDPPTIRPNAATPVVIPTGFNPSHVTGYRAGGREFVLVTVSGAVGLVTDDRDTRDVIERGAVARTAASIDVIDAETLELVATWPLGLAGLSSEGLGLDPSGRVALVGSQVDRAVYAVDLAPLATLPAAGGTPWRLDSAVIFDAERPFRIPSIAGGAPSDVCPGFTAGVAFNHAGDLAFVSEFCDGSLTGVGVDLSGDPTSAELPDRFTLVDVQAIVAPIRTDTLGLARAPGAVRVRPGEPGVDFAGPDVFVLVGEPEGMLCGIRIESL